jgi:hypothetical protein
MKKISGNHCILVIRSNQEMPLLEAMLPRRIRRLEVTDWDSSLGQGILKGRRQLGFFAPRPVFRFDGILSSSGHVKNANLLHHIEWLFSNFKDSFNLSDLKLIGAEYELSFAWYGGDETSPVPLIQPALATLLVHHHVALDICIY